MINDTLFWQGMVEAAAGMLLISIGLAGLLIIWTKWRSEK